MLQDTRKVQNEHFNGLSPAEAERLAMLSEECAEVIQAIGKALRHGYESTWDNGMSNREYIEKELGDVDAIVTLMSVEGDVDDVRIGDLAEEKLTRVRGFTHHQDWDK